MWHVTISGLSHWECDMSRYQVCHTLIVTCHDIRCVTFWVWHVTISGVPHSDLRLLNVTSDMSRYQVCHSSHTVDCGCDMSRYQVCHTGSVTCHEIRRVTLWVWHVTISGVSHCECDMSRYHSRYQVCHTWHCVSCQDAICQGCHSSHCDLGFRKLGSVTLWRIHCYVLDFSCWKCHIVTLVTLIWSEHHKKNYMRCARTNFWKMSHLAKPNVTLAYAMNATKFWKVSS